MIMTSLNHSLGRAGVAVMQFESMLVTLGMGASPAARSLTRLDGRLRYHAIPSVAEVGYLQKVP
jgi:hypothetical protein